MALEVAEISRLLCGFVVARSRPDLRCPSRAVSGPSDYSYGAGRVLWHSPSVFLAARRVFGER
jgi:hypothetical protein